MRFAAILVFLASTAAEELTAPHHDASKQLHNSRSNTLLHDLDTSIVAMEKDSTLDALNIASPNLHLAQPRGQHSNPWAVLFHSDTQTGWMLCRLYPVLAARFGASRVIVAAQTQHHSQPLAASKWCKGGVPPIDYPDPTLNDMKKIVNRLPTARGERSVQCGGECQVFYFHSGHGGERGGGWAFSVENDADYEVFSGMEFFHQFHALKDQGATSIVSIVNTCYSGGLHEMSHLSGSTSPAKAQAAEYSKVTNQAFALLRAEHHTLPLYLATAGYHKDNFDEATGAYTTGAAQFQFFKPFVEELETARETDTIGYIMTTAKARCETEFLKPEERDFGLNTVTLGYNGQMDERTLAAALPRPVVGEY